MIKITGKQTRLAEIANAELEKLDKRMLELGMEPKLEIECHSYYITIHVGLLKDFRYIGASKSIAADIREEIMQFVIDRELRMMIQTLFFA